MELCAKLETILEDQELSSISEVVKRKINEQLLNFNQIISELRNENGEFKAILERHQFQYEKEVTAVQHQLQESTDSCTKLKLQISELEDNLSSIQKELRDLQKLHDSSQLEFQASKRDNELLKKEKQNLTEQLEKRREEIEKLNEDVKNLVAETTKANEEKFESIAAAEEAKMKESSLQHQVNRLEQERELLNNQIADLNAELTEKNHEIHTLKREKSNNILDLKARLEDRADEIQLLQKRLDYLKELVEEKDARIEALAEKIRQLNQSHSQAEEQFNLELNAQSKLIDLHKKASEDNQQRVEELMRAFEEAQKLLRESNESCDEMEKHYQVVENKCKEELEAKQKEIFQLKEELRKAKDDAHGFSQDALEKMFPVAAATSKVLHSGMTLTELYVEFTRVQEELQQQKNENAKLTQELKHIIAEIEEKTPVINQRMLEYEKSKETITCLRSQLASALADYEKMLEERNDAKRISNSLERENSRLKSQVLDLNRQVQVLLKEIEEARGRSILDHRDNDKLQEEEEEEVTSTDDITADKVISRHLVTFKDIVEIQRKNQQLLTVIRDLSKQHEEMEKKLSSDISMKFEKDIAALSSQLEDLQKKRAKQSEMLETIVRQRDMYRVLLTSQGFSESLLGQPEGSLSFLQNNSSPFSPGDSRLKETKSAMNQLQAEFTNYKKEKAQNEKMLNEQLDNMRNEISDLRVQNAKLASQIEYSEERVQILQSNLETYKKEYASFKEKNRQHSAMIIQHQQTINSLRQDLMVAQEKVAKSEVTISNLKAECELLRNAEQRLLQEKESAVREQQHQSRMMSNLQAVQNNLERIESETKRNLQYQIEKCEKENSILKTKLDNANEDYRNAVKVWEKLNKDLQAKVDAEVERNRKLHEDLVDAYSQVHALNQELLNMKSQLTTPEKSSNAESSAKTPQKSASAEAQAVAEVKLLKEQLNEAQMKIKALQDKLDLTTKSSEQYSNMCNDLELRLKEQDVINKQLKESMDSALLSSNEARNALEKSLEDMEKSNRELIEENMKLTQNSDSQVNELQKKVTDLLRLMDDYKNQAEVAKKTEEQARNDCQNQIKLMQEVQEKYERELMLHAEDIKVLSELKEEHQKCTSEIKKLTETAKRAEQTLSESKESWLRQEEIFQREVEALKTKISDLEECNSNLHDQLELMGTQMAALQSKNWNETPYASIQTDLKDTQHLLQVIQFIKKEKEIACTQFDVAQSENVRLNLKVEQLTSELNDAKAELREMMNNTQAKAASDAQHTELLKKIEMMNLLSESNNLLRMEKESLSEAKMKLEEQLHELQEKFQPLSEKEKEMTQQIDMLTAENAALRVEVKSWQSRTNQLLEQSHRIGPQEYKNMMREIEELKAQKGRLAEELQRKQAEVSQIASNLSSAVKELDNSRAELKEKSQELVKMNEDNVEHQKTLLQIKKIGRKYKTQYDELKVNYDTLMAKVKSSDQVSQEQAAQEMQKKLEESERIMKELKEEIEKQKESVNQANKTAETVQNKANEKEEKAKKLLAQFRHKYSQLNTEKESLISEKNSLMKKVEELNSLVSTLMASQEENLQSKSQAEAKIARLEKELRMAKDLRISERDYLQKQYDELYQKVSQQQKQTAKSTMVGLGDRSSGSGTEPLTANIKPLTSPSTSGTSSSLRHSPHPHAASNINRPTPTASIRPMAIGTASSTPPPQARMAAVLPTTATPPHSEEVVAPTVPVTVPHAAVQPTPATATVAPTTVAAAVSPVISEVAPTVVTVIEGREDSQVDSLHGAHITGGSVPSIPAAAVVVLPRIEESETSTEQATVDSPAPTTSVIVSPPATQTQVVTPTVKRQREESISPNESQETSHKRVRMVSEGSQTNQQMPVATTVATPTNVAVVSAAQIISRNKTQSSPVAEIVQPTSAQADTKETPIPVVSAPEPPISTVVVEEEPVAIPVTIEAEILDADEKDDQNIEWESQDDAKIDDEYEAEVMEEEPVVDEDIDEVEQMQETDVRSPDDEDMTEDQQDDAEEMAESTPTAQDIDIQMDADSSSLQTAPTEQCMAPPADPPTLGMPVRTEISPATEAMAQSTSNVTMQRLPVPVVPSRLDRSAPISRQHLTPFTISGQSSNFEEGDDSIVPSTPTLYVPRRADGFAEAVSSPHVPQVRFLFSSSESSPTQQGLSQLASQGALGVDDTRMDLSQFDESGGRTVPSTPLQVSPPTEATVPEVSESNLEVDVGIANNDFTIPVIKVDLVEETSDNAGTSQNISKTEASEEASVTTTDGNEIKSEEDKTKQLDAQPSDASTPSENKHEVPTSESQSAEENAKTDQSPDTDQSNKDVSSSQTSRRKPIVWRKKSDGTSDSEASELASAGTSSSSSGLLPTPGRGRTRVRRMRYPISGGNYSRGRGTEATWSGSGRRGRTSVRRRSMY